MADGGLSDHRVIKRLKRWGAYLGMATPLLGALAGTWKVIDYVSDLRDTIGDNKVAVGRMSNENEQAHRELVREIQQVVEAVRSQREQDQAVITNLRIAVAALQAAQAVRDGRASYQGLPSLSGGSQGRSEASPPSSARHRAAQAAEADEDVTQALERAAQIQSASSNFSELGGL